MQRSISEEFAKRASTLKNASADDVSGRLASIITWLEKDPVTRTALAKLRAGVDEDKIFPKTREAIARPAAHTPEEIAFVGLTLMENCRDHNADFLHLCIAVGIDPGNFELMLQQGFHDYIYPFLEYVAVEIDAAAEETSIEGVLEMRMTDILTGELRELTPVTSAALAEVAKEFSTSSKDTKWQNVGNSCRHILKEFVHELCQARNISVPYDVQAGNFKELGKRLVQAADSRGTVAKLIDAIWDHSQTVTHRPTTTKDEALRVFVWTCLAASEIARAVSNKS
jgi:hypothetical protein